MTPRLRLKFRSSCEEAKARNILTRHGLPFQPIHVADRPRLPALKLPRIPEFMTAQELYENLTRSERDSVLLSILTALESAQSRSTRAALAAIDETIKDAAVWAESHMETPICR